MKSLPTIKMGTATPTGVLYEDIISKYFNERYSYAMGDNNKSNPIAIGAKFDWSSAEKANENYRQLVKARDYIIHLEKNAKGGNFR